MDDDLPLIFTPLVRQPGSAIPDWHFGSAGVAGLPAPLSPPQGVNVAVGIDIIEVERVRKVYEHHGERFLKRVFTEMEVRQCRGKANRLAGRFAAKEAISKALGTGLHGVAWRETTDIFADPLHNAGEFVTGNPRQIDRKDLSGLARGFDKIEMIDRGVPDLHQDLVIGDGRRGNVLQR